MSQPSQQACPRCVHCHDVIHAYAAVIVVANDGERRRTMLGVEPLDRRGQLFHAQCHELHQRVTLQD